MEHSKKFQTVKKYFDRGMWTAEAVGKAVVMNWITADEYEEITGEPYEVN